MLNYTVKGRELIARGMVLIAISLILAFLMGVLGCSGGPKKDPTDPVGSKPADKNTGTDRLSNTGPGTGTLGTTPRVRYGAPGALLESLLTNGGGQAGDVLSDRVLAGVFDARTLEPIEGAYVSVGDDGTSYGQTDDIGCVLLTGDFSPVGFGGGAGDDIFITAGTDGYELLSFNDLRFNVACFLLDSLTPYTPETATVEGVVDFNTDDFIGEVYATTAVTYTDQALAPAGGGDEDDTYSVDVRAGELGRLICVMRDTSSDEILRLFTAEIPALDPDETYVISAEYVEPSGPGLGGIGSGPDIGVEDTIQWQEWCSTARDYQGSVNLFTDLAPEINQIWADFIYHSERWGEFTMNDATAWDTKAGFEDTVKWFDTKFAPAYSQMIPFQTMSVWVKVRYNDASGSDMLMDYGASVAPQGFIKLRNVPSLVAPVDEATGVGLTPDIEFLCDPEDVYFSGKITFVDTLSSTQWAVLMTPSDFATTLPTLPVAMSGWGLTEDNPVAVTIEMDMGMFTATMMDGSTVSTQSLGDLSPRSFSKVFEFTP
jgi:hypothetical protein